VTNIFSNNAPGDQGSPDFRKDFEDYFLNCPVISPMVDETLSWLEVQIRGEEEWEDGLRKVLDEMKPEGLLILWDRRFQIDIRPYDCRLVWAYTHRDSWIAEYIDLKPTTQVLLVISATKVEDRPTKLFEKLLRHQIGHVLRYLQHPGAQRVLSRNERVEKMEQMILRRKNSR